MPQHTKAERRKTAKKVSRKISKLRGEGKPPRQAIAQAISTVRRQKAKAAKKRRK